jgi:hypothetical protein
MRSRIAGVSAVLVVMLAAPVPGTAPVLADPGTVHVAGAKGLAVGLLTVRSASTWPSPGSAGC